MDEDMLVRGLMDFGSSGWRTGLARRSFVGLICSDMDKDRRPEPLDDLV